MAISTCWIWLAVGCIALKLSRAALTPGPSPGPEGTRDGRGAGGEGHMTIPTT